MLFTSCSESSLFVKYSALIYKFTQVYFMLFHCSVIYVKMIFVESVSKTLTAVAFEVFYLSDLSSNEYKMNEGSTSYS